MPGLVILVSIQGSDAASSAVMVGTCVAKDAWRVGAIVRLTGRSREVVSVSLNKSSACIWLSAALIQNTHTHVDISFSHGMWFYVRILLVACRSPNKSQRTSSSRERSKHNNTKRMVRHACRGGVRWRVDPVRCWCPRGPPVGSADDPRRCAHIDASGYRREDEVAGESGPEGDGGSEVSFFVRSGSFACIPWLFGSQLHTCMMQSRTKNWRANEVERREGETRETLRYRSHRRSHFGSLAALPAAKALSAGGDCLCICNRRVRVGLSICDHLRLAFSCRIFQASILLASLTHSSIHPSLVPSPTYYCQVAQSRAFDIDLCILTYN